MINDVATYNYMHVIMLTWRNQTLQLWDTSQLSISGTTKSLKIAKVAKIARTVDRGGLLDLALLCPLCQQGFSLLLGHVRMPEANEQHLGTDKTPRGKRWLKGVGHKRMVGGWSCDMVMILLVILKIFSALSLQSLLPDAHVKYIHWKLHLLWSYNILYGS